MDPKNAGEWQEAVDAAHFFIHLDSARQYGLVSGGPAVNVDRCEELLRRGRAAGFVPARDAIEQGVRALNEAMAATRKAS